MSLELSAARKAAVAWARSAALPLWHQAGWDRKQGGFVERLTPEGVADLTAPRRVRVQARQIYVYAHAATLGWYEPARHVALEAFDWLTARCRRPGGGPGFVHVVEADGRIIDGRIDAYDQAFGLLALAWMFRLTGDAQIRGLIDEEIAFLDSKIADPAAGGWLEGVPSSLPRRQNPQMHAFEAMLALFEATGDPEFLRRAEGFLKLLESRLFDRDSGVLLEYFGPGFEPSSDADKLIVEPGHHFEWVWLLSTYARLAGRAVPALAPRLFDWAVRYGLTADGLAIDECRPSGAALLASCRLWPQTEYVKASLALEEMGGAADAAARADSGLAVLASRYFTTSPAGGWIDRLDAAGKVADARMPTSSLYHIFCAIAEAARVGGKSRP